MTRSLFTVEISPPKHQGMMLSFASDSEVFRQDFSTQVYPFLEQLIGAIRMLRDEFVDERIKLLIGEPECEFVFRADDNPPEASLRVELWPDHRRNTFFTPKIVFSIYGTRDQIVAPFVTAFRKLRATINDVDFEREYGSAFPTLQYDLLMASA